MTTDPSTGGVMVGAVAIMGLDGTGKSTLAELLESTRARAGTPPVRLHHASTKVPGVRELKARYHSKLLRMLRRGNSGSREGTGGADRASGTRGAVAWSMSIYLLLGSFIKSVWYRWRYRGRLLILDRCFLDDVVKVRWRFGVRTRLSGILMRSVPAPGLILVLEGDPEVTFGRKKAYNCTYGEYLDKRHELELALQEAVDLGWVVERLAVDHQTPAEVLQCALRILERYQLRLGGEEPRGAPGGRERR